MKTVIVTGVSGYIGGEVAIKLHDAGHTVIGIDRRPLPNHLKHYIKKFVHADFADLPAQVEIISSFPDAVVHCAGTSLVGPSILNPQEYYHNNVVKTILLLDIIKKSLPKTRIIFSSSAATYGLPVMLPCDEVDPCAPISPYGESKLVIERVMQSYNVAYGLDFVAFRYFNAAGADSQGRHGQEPNATHIVARILESLINKTKFILNGTNFQTKDGTCIRDYVHVEDIADAHVQALDRSIPSGIYNLGTNVGTSNREIISIAQTVTGKTVDLVESDARPGDPDMLTATPARFVALGWNPKYTITDIIKHAWIWYNK